MTDYKLLAEALFWISVIMLSPGFFVFTRAAIKYFFFRFVSDEKIILTVKKGGTVTKSIEIKTTGYVVDQVRSQFKANET